MKQYFKIGFMIMVLVAICVCILPLSGCTKEQEPPVYELKLYDDNWNEVKMIARQDGDFLIKYDVVYDGMPKGLNAICYKDGEEFYRYQYQNGFVRNNMVAVWSQFNGAGGWGLTEFPTMPGATYRFTYTFDRGLGGGGGIIETPIGSIDVTTLPKTMYHVSMHIHSR